MRVGWRCSNPDCRAPTTGPVSDPTGVSIVGVAAHITAASPAGPRFDPDLTAQGRKSVRNGIWLCALCATKIDDDASRYASSVLRFWRLDAENLADQEKGRPPATTETLRFAVIGLEPGCMWRSSHRLAKVTVRIGAAPQLTFHALAQHSRAAAGASPERHCCDPIFDLTLVNDSPRTSVLSSIGFVAQALWSDLKGLPRPYRVRVTEAYVMQCDTIAVDVPQLLELPDPVGIPAGLPLRIKLTLAGFRASLRGNESLLRLLAIADGDLHRSRMINMGVY